MLKLRPTFEVSLNESREIVIERLRHYRSQLAQCELCQIYGEYGELHLPTDQHRLWSPYLTFYVSEAEPGSVIHGRFTPRLDVWTTVWIFYLAMSFTALFGLVFGYSQWLVGESPWGYALTVLGVIAVTSLYMIASMGQQWSADQMLELRQKLDEYLRICDLTLSPANRPIEPTPKLA